MSDNSRGIDEGRSLGPMIGFAAGALVGGLLGVLLAPDSGTETRRRLGETARRMGSDARDKVSGAGASVADAARGLGADVKNAVGVGLETFRHDGDARDFRTSGNIVPPARPTGPKTL